MSLLRPLRQRWWFALYLHLRRCRAYVVVDVLINTSIAIDPRPTGPFYDTGSSACFLRF